MSRIHLWIIYLTLGFLVVYSLAGRNNSPKLGKLDERITKLEFLQEANRIRDNVVGFKQVNASLSDNNERSKSCTENKDLLTEWSEDIKKLGNDFSSLLNNSQDVKNYFDSISKLNDTVVADCNKLTSQK